jgi:hypothetical protein
VKKGAKTLESEFEKGLRGVEEEFGPLGGVREKSEVERVDIAVGRLERKKETAGVDPAWGRSTGVGTGSFFLWFAILNITLWCNDVIATIF